MKDNCFKAKLFYEATDFLLGLIISTMNYEDLPFISSNWRW